jgi:hypothetical protein
MNYAGFFSLLNGARSVIALPLIDFEDYLHYDREVQGRQVRVTLLDENSAHPEDWAKRIGRPGHMERVNDKVTGFIFDQPLNTTAVEQVRAEGK